jgi:hypothetical protein
MILRLWFGGMCVAKHASSRYLVSVVVAEYIDFFVSLVPSTYPHRDDLTRQGGYRVAEMLN